MFMMGIEWIGILFQPVIPIVVYNSVEVSFKEIITIISRGTKITQIVILSLIRPK